MEIFDILTILLLLSASFAYVNTRWIKLPPTLGFMLGSLVLSLALLAMQAMGIAHVSTLIQGLLRIDFGSTVLYGILSFLLFAVALQFDVREVGQERWVILSLATVGVVLSTFFFGTLMYVGLNLIGISMPYLYALGFGALISPTDPVIVIGMLKGTKTSKSIRMKMMGEALFNDGVAIVLFTVLFGLAFHDTSLDWAQAVSYLFRNVAGALTLGLIFGYLTWLFLSHINVVSAQLLITLGMVAGGYDLALIFDVSGPITVVILGVFVRNFRRGAQSVAFRQEKLYDVWELIDEFLNAALFVMMGLQILALQFSWIGIVAGLLAIIASLASRYASMWIPIRIFHFVRPFTKNVVELLTWGGLRGGISLALALSLPHDKMKTIVLAATYMIVIFSTVVQGLTFRKIVNRSQSI